MNKKRTILIATLMICAAFILTLFTMGIVYEKLIKIDIEIIDSERLREEVEIECSASILKLMLEEWGNSVDVQVSARVSAGGIYEDGDQILIKTGIQGNIFETYECRVLTIGVPQKIVIHTTEFDDRVVIEPRNASDIFCKLGEGNDIFVNNPDLPNANTEVHGEGGNDLIQNKSIDADFTDLNLVNIITGGEGKDLIRGGNGDELILGNGGNDEILGGFGDDTLDGGPGDDRLEGNEGDDILKGQNGSDIILGGPGDDTLLGGEGFDNLYGEAGGDSLQGGDGRDLLNGGSEGDWLDGGPDKDKIYGGPGSDTLLGKSGGDYLYGGSGNDTLYGHSGIDRIYGQDGNDTISGGEDPDWLQGGPGYDFIVDNDPYDMYVSD